MIHSLRSRVLRLIDVLGAVGVMAGASGVAGGQRVWMPGYGGIVRSVVPGLVPLELLQA